MNNQNRFQKSPEAMDICLAPRKIIWYHSSFPDNYQVEITDTLILTPKEMKLVHIIVMFPGRVLASEDIMCSSP